MRTPSLRNRVVVLGVLVVAVVVVIVDVTLYLTFRAQLFENLHEVLRERVELVTVEARSHTGADLAQRLIERGVAATIRAPDGTQFAAEPPSPLLGRGLPGGREPNSSVVSRTVSLADGSTATVFARRTGVDEAVRKLLLLEGLGLVAAVSLAGLLLLRTSELALRPLNAIAASARRTSAGRRGERLRPDRPETALGQLASAYDEMLDTLEASVGQASSAQVESELLYMHLRQVIETANAGFVEMDHRGVITDWNSKAEEIFGWRRTEVVGRPLAETLVPPALRPAHVAGLQRFLETGEHRVLGNIVELEALHRDGHLIPVEVSTWVTYLGDDATFSAFIRDITVRRQGEEAIGRLASIVESAQEAIISTSLDGTILTWNFGAERLYQYTAEEAIGRDVSLIVPPDQAVEIERVREHIARGESLARYETVRQRRDGSRVEVAVTTSPVFDAWGAVTGTSIIARDITEQRRMAMALEETLGALERALEDARRSEERTRQFLADAAHQLRSPVAGVRACAETLLRGASDLDRDDLLASLVRETSRAGRLITALLRLAVIDQAPPLEARRCDVVTLCRSEVDRARSLAPELTVDLQVIEPPDEPVELDADSVTEILSNLLDNARRHAATCIRVTVKASQEQLQIVVADDGSGVPDDLVEKIFDRFVSLDGRGGSGLGLPIARALARSHGGDLTYDAAGFVLTVPVGSRVGADSWLRA
ncbi:MAG: PAS domain S-box protein [Actinomycetota bacterium]|nr:PAS domain S-box protein [Actinomycetota bacterium]